VQPMAAALRSHSIGFADGTFGYSAQMGSANACQTRTRP